MRLRVARDKLRAIVDRASVDPAYLNQLQINPVDALVKEGLPYDVIEDFLRETGMQAEVSGFVLQGCANTCALSRLTAYPKEFQNSGHTSS